MKTVGALVKHREIYFVKPENSILEVARYMAERRIGATPVIHNNKLIGIFSERDLMTRVVARGLRAAEVKVTEVMTSEVITARADESYDACLAKMQMASIRHLPIISEDNFLIGTISIRDLLIFDNETKSKDIEMLNDYINHRPTALG